MEIKDLYSTRDLGASFTIPKNEGYKNPGEYVNMCFLKSLTEGLSHYFPIDSEQKKTEVYDILIDTMRQYNIKLNKLIPVPGNIKFIQQIEKDWDISIYVFGKAFERAYPILIDNQSQNNNIINIAYINPNHFILIDHYEIINNYSNPETAQYALDIANVEGSS